MQNSTGLSEISWLLIGWSPRRGFCRPVKWEKPVSEWDMPIEIRDYCRSMIQFKSVLTAAHQPAHICTHMHTKKTSRYRLLFPHHHPPFVTHKFLTVLTVFDGSKKG